MIGTPLWWYTQFAINFLDFIIIYVFAHTIVRSKIKIKVTHVLFCVAYTLALAPVFYFWGGYIFNILINLCMILFTKLVTKRSNLSELLTIYAICFIILTTINMTILPFIWIFNDQSLIALPLIFLISQLIVTISMILICKKININYWFNIIQRNNDLKLTLCLMSFAFIAISFITNFELDILFYIIPLIIYYLI